MRSGQFFCLFCVLFHMISTKKINQRFNNFKENSYFIPENEMRIILNVHNKMRMQLANGLFGNPRIGDMSLMDIDANLSKEARSRIDEQIDPDFEKQMSKGIVSFYINRDLQNNLFSTIEREILISIRGIIELKLPCSDYLSVCKNMKQVLYSKSDKIGCAKRPIIEETYEYFCLYNKKFSHLNYSFEEGTPCSLCQEHQRVCYDQTLCASQDQCDKPEFRMSCLTRKGTSYNLKITKMTSSGSKSNDPIHCTILKRLCYQPEIIKLCPHTCSEGLLLKTREYHVITDKMTFEAANFYCKHKNMQLPKIEDSETDTYIYGLAKQHNLSFYWINGNDKKIEGVFVNTDNEKLTYTNWHPKQPDNYNKNENCMNVLTNENGLWNDDDCNKYFNVICQPLQKTKNNFGMNKSTLGATACYCTPMEYHVATEKMTFEAANSYCKNRKMQLPKIENAETDIYIYGLAMKNNLDDYWINGNDKESEGIFMSTDNEKVTYTNWHPKQPDNLNEEDCMNVFINHNGKWNDNRCYVPLNVICQPLQKNVQGA